MTKHPFLALALASLASCGGDSATSDDYQAALAAADARRAEALALAPASPCDAVQQCANLALVRADGHCGSTDYHPYSIASPTAAAASAAAADERTLAEHAVAIAPPPPTVCTTLVTAPPDLACVANVCQAVPPVR
jgi:ABC-type phosphate/phosphonate transport system substrate-binding protein